MLIRSMGIRRVCAYRYPLVRAVGRAALLFMCSRNCQATGQCKSTPPLATFIGMDFLINHILPCNSGLRKSSLQVRTSPKVQTQCVITLESQASPQNRKQQSREWSNPLAAQSVAIVYLLYIRIGLNEEVVPWQNRYQASSRQHRVPVPEIAQLHRRNALNLETQAIPEHPNPLKPRSPTGTLRNAAQS